MLNFRFVLQQLARLTGVMGLALLLVAVWSLGVDPMPSPGAPVATEGLFVATAGAVVLAALAWLISRGRQPGHLGRREALTLVGASWLMGSLLAALPYFLWACWDPTLQSPHPFRSFAACLFESVSGLTTTGATVVSDIEALPRSLLLWRAVTHWLGGLGIVVLFVAVLPNVGVGGKRLFMTEVTGPTKSGLRPRISEAARALLLIYCALNAIEIVCLRLCGLSWFDAVCESFATIASGGFSTRAASTAGYDNFAAEIVLIVFMLLSGVNFGLYFHLFRGRWRAFTGDPELRFYLLLTLIGGALIVWPLVGQPIVLATGQVLEPGVAPAVRHGLFNFISLRTNTGFATADVNPWGFLPATVIMVTMSMGACSGSTAGGIKLVRVLVAMKVVLHTVNRAFRPSLIKPVRLGDQTIDPQVRNDCVTFVLVYGLTLGLGGIALHLTEPDPAVSALTTFSASAACLSNSGPGLGLVGTVLNYGWMTPASHLVCCAIMLLGRLEIYALIALFLPSFWKGD